VPRGHHAAYCEDAKQTDAEPRLLVIAALKKCTSDFSARWSAFLPKPEDIAARMHTSRRRSCVAGTVLLSASVPPSGSRARSDAKLLDRPGWLGHTENALNPALGRLSLLCFARNRDFVACAVAW